MTHILIIVAPFLAKCWSFGGGVNRCNPSHSLSRSGNKHLDQKKQCIWQILGDTARWCKKKKKWFKYLSNEHGGKCFRIFSATETLAASINSSTIWFASRIWYIPAFADYALGININTEWKKQKNNEKAKKKRTGKPERNRYTT